ncbi:DEAD DEAH box helicase [Coemansia sp. RSA 1813]|nr:putative ATP-dependent helicase IRC3 [Coemansia sp. RSA 1646]KAJ1766347.1 DEAD DEAH box helicase [Coemansia sp. RSA 1843]KAJ2085465.1 DEAD DEAH box helicase [Coemansia sp. RSA 986]KAJ2210362.1 DEAD DEAH box helicase [Coemansia sp. RSA 487]KAJ2562689.1 DEAD DEAH box helicase [Coemansia sp. RSA 1813]
MLPGRSVFFFRSTVRRRRWRRLVHTLRPYQKECIDACITLLEQGLRRQAVSLPVGSGKTVIFSNLINRVQPPTPMATKTLVLAHREELLAQAARQIQRASPNLVVDIDQGTRVANPAADVIVASVPTLGREQTDRLSRYDPRRFKLIVIDEAHHAAAETYNRIIKHFETQGAGQSDVLVWGCSATLYRHDGLGLGGVFDKIVYQKNFIDMIREGYLARMKVVTVCTSTKIDGVRAYAGDFSPKALSSAVNNETRNLAIVKAYQTLAMGKRKSTLVFAVDIAHAQTLCKILNHYGVLAKAILSTTSLGERETAIQEFRDGTLPVIVNCGILTEGTDIPNIDCVMMARPTRSLGLFQQMIGRGMRLFPGKDDCLVVDLVDSFSSAAGGRITVPTLLGLDPELILKETDILDGRAVSQLAEQHKQSLLKGLEGNEDTENTQSMDNPYGVLDELNKELLDTLPKSIGSLESMGYVAKTHLNPLNFFELHKKLTHPTSKLIDELDMVSSGNHNLRKLSIFSWVSLTPMRYTVGLRGANYEIKKCPADGLWHGHLRQMVHRNKEMKQSGGKAGSSFYSFNTELKMQAETLEHAIRAMDSLIKSKCKSQFEIKTLMWNAPWRKLPPTPMQIKMLERHGINVHRGNKKKTLKGKAFSKKIASGPAITEVEGEEAEEESGKPSVSDMWLTRGIATNIISRIRSGSVKWWRDAAKAQDKLDAKREKVTDLKKLVAWNIGNIATKGTVQP